MNIKKIVLAVAIASAVNGNAWAAESKIADPYKSDQSNSPWTMSMENVTTLGGRVIRGDATLLAGKEFKGFDAYTPYAQDKTQVFNGYGSSSVGVGCDGINLGGVIDGQLSQYGNMVEAFIQQAPTLAIMYLAYSQPTVKAVIDELNTVGQFGLDLSNMTCSGVRAIADKSAEEKAQAMAEAQCTAEAGFKDPDCMSDDGILSNVTKVMKTTKSTVNERAGAFLGRASNATGGLVRFSGGVDVHNAVTGSTSSGGGSTTGNNTPPVTRPEACANIPTDGLRSLLLGSSGMACADIENYAELLPDYKINDDGVSGVVPRTMTIRKLAADLVVQHEAWLNNLLAAPENDFVNSEGFKAIFNRTNVAISTAQHRKINLAAKNQPHKAVGIIRNLAQVIALKDLNAIVGSLEVAILTGIQNQPDDQLLPAFRRDQFVHAVETLKAELRALNEEISYDLKRSEILM